MYKKSEEYSKKQLNKISENYSIIIEEVGENKNREGLQKTPIRCAKSILFLTQGYNIKKD